ncbi:hypothetical protein TERTU_2382 [Teredinibacter turnerae T7901]|uniref:Uncharacterized protein n=1 Tax=Teredinibacter turnerae (strain ATCC 39867 / T7901) TaxID=377629 RepID=C5BKC1_TERTT|nr:hypothetical protein TERTU_2382 [Teredinibacter turnerae T7901]
MLLLAPIFFFESVQQAFWVYAFYFLKSFFVNLVNNGRVMCL